MGAVTFDTVAVGKTAREAFHAAVSNAIYEYGHDPYSGTIATKSSDGFNVVGLDQKKFTRAAINRWLDAAWENTGKWGACWCLELPRKKGDPRGCKRYLFAGWASS